jgi:hypothetical protein
MNTRGKTKLKVWATLIVVFALGGVTGAALDAIYRLPSKAAPPSQAAPSDREIPSMRDTDAYFETMKRELALTAEQATAMRTILEQTREDYRAVCADVRPRYDGLRERARGEMRALLTSDQQQRFDTIVTQEDCRCPEMKK